MERRGEPRDPPAGQGPRARGPSADRARAAADTTFSFDIPATTLARALPLVAEQSGVVVGMPGRLPRVRTLERHRLRFALIDAVEQAAQRASELTGSDA